MLLAAVTRRTATDLQSGKVCWGHVFYFGARAKKRKDDTKCAKKGFTGVVYNPNPRDCCGLVT